MSDKQQNKSTQTSADAAALRKRAEEQVWSMEQIPQSAQTPEETRRVLHELRVHQIELEMQNEELRAAQARIEAGRARYFDLYDLAPVGYCTLSEQGLIREANLTVATLLGVTRGALVKQPISRFIIKEDEAIYYLHRKKLFETGEPQEYELRLAKPDGTHFWAHLAATAAQAEDSTPVCRMVLSDISERKRSENILAFLAQSSANPASGEFFQMLARYIAETLEMGFVCIDRLDGDHLTAHTEAVYSNGRFEDNVSYALKDTPCGEVVGKQVCCFPASIKRLFPNDAVLQNMEAESYLGVTLWSHDGRPIGLIAVIGARPLTHRAQAESLLKLVGVRAAAELERKLTEEKFREAAERLRLANKATNDVIWDWDVIHDTQQWNEAGTAVFGWTEIVERPVSADWRVERVHPDDQKRVHDSFLAVVNNPELDVWQDEYRFRKADSTEAYVLDRGYVLRDDQGKAIRMIGAMQDITERKQVAERLHHAHRRLESIIEGTGVGTWEWNVQTGATIFNENWARIIGYALDELEPISIKTWETLAHPDDLKQSDELLKRHFAGELQYYDCDCRIRHKDGHWIWMNDRGRVITRTADGKPLMMIGTHIDINARKQAEADREKLQAQLTQAQKMESVGRLAGGVAHDFNNMLGVIIGYSEMILEEMDPTQQFHAELEEIQKAARRSADLTRQLLTFARKQLVAPKVLDVNQTIEGMFNMLRRLIGENIDLIWMSGSGLWPINMDPSQIDQILANLCVNARDAINGVGKLTVETKNATFDEEYCATHAGSLPGEYVRIDVSDTGSGMDKETLAHIFEPFFTTKEVGEGTGLGLAMVYGAVKQNNGFINAYSELGRGTTFTIYIPRHVETTTETRVTASTEPVVSGDEIVMLVEDEPTLLHMSKTMLERLGYTVLAAETPSEAIRLASEYSGQIHLLATDVIMPEMNGHELSARLLASRPEMKCLFMSGYTANIIAKQGVLNEGVSFIQKPFSKKKLAAKIRETLET